MLDFMPENPRPTLTRWLSIGIVLLGSFVAKAQTPAIIISELNYNPPGDEALVASAQTEFIEIKNVGSTSINLSTIGFSIWDDTGAISTITNSTLAAGQRGVFPRSLSAFNAKYPGVATQGVINARSLSNSGERFRLRYKVSNADTTFYSLTYGTRNPWPSLPDGSGFTLVPVNPSPLPTAIPDPNDPLNWRTSTNLYGSPGADDPAPPIFPIVINELQTRNDTSLNSDSFELANLSENPVDISNWFLTDKFDSLDPAKVALDPTLAAHRYKIPSPTTIPARGFLTFTQAQLGFGISGSGGDELMLFAANASGALTGYKHSAKPGASANMKSFNRTVSSDGREFFMPSISNSLGLENAAPYVGPVIFSKINYNPSTTTSVVVKSEYIEVVNRSSQPVNLFSSDVNITLATEKTWRVKGVYSRTNTTFTFPANVTLAAGEIVLLIPAKPSGTVLEAEATTVANFRTANKVPVTVTKIYTFCGFNDASTTQGLAPTDGNILSNSSQILELARPERIASVDTATNTTTYSVNFLTEDFAAYQDGNGWPSKADGDDSAVPASYYSRALVRTNPDGFGGDPVSWDVSVANGGTPGYAVVPTSRSVVINEILAHSDLTDPTHPSRTDFIELHNPTASDVNISGWWLTNSLDKLAIAYDRVLNGQALLQSDPVYPIPAGTTIPAGGFWAVNGDNDDNVSTVPILGTFYGRNFSLNSRGDSCYLVQVDSNNKLTGRVYGTDFDAEENPVSFIRYRNTEGRETFVASQSITCSFTTASAFPVGAANSQPAISPVVISEILYNAPVGGYEFIELYNSSSSAVALYDNYNEIPGHTFNSRHNANNGWNVSGVDFKFASSAGSRPTIAPGEVIILTNAPTAAAFRAYFTTTPVSTRIFTWATGSLSNEGERVKLQKPDQEDVVNSVTVVPYINVDEAAYKPYSPWPQLGFDGGFTLERRNFSYIGDDAGNWQASSTVQGTPGVVAVSRNTLSLWNQSNFTEAEIIAGQNLGAFDDFNGDGTPNLLHYLYGLSPKSKPAPADLPYFGTVNLAAENYLTLTYREQVGTIDFGLTAQDSATLLSWATTNVQPVSSVSLGNGVNRVTVRYATPMTPSLSRAFLRLSAAAK